jgi:hypothetical protein
LEAYDRLAGTYNNTFGGESKSAFEDARLENAAVEAYDRPAGIRNNPF